MPRPPAEPVSVHAPALVGPVMMTQDWRDLTFLHWAVEPQRVRRLMPPGVRPDVFEGRTYVGLIPFRMVDAGLARGPAVPWAGTFLETNVRLYSVDDTGRRGIVFLSLDTDRSVIVAGARVTFGLPYRWARMRHRVSRAFSAEGAGAGAAGAASGTVAGDVHTYDARLRRLGRRPSSHVQVRVGEPRAATELDLFLSARWGLHVRWLGRTRYVPNTHDTWPLHDAEVLALDDGLLGTAGLGELTDRRPDHVAFSPGVHTEFGFPSDARRPRPTPPAR